MLRFIISLWASKLCLFLFKHTGRERDDRPGILALILKAVTCLYQIPMKVSATSGLSIPNVVVP